MAKKPDDKIKVDDVDSLDDFDWPDFDFDETAGDKQTKGRKPITRMASTAAKEAGKYVVNPQNIARSVKQVMPGSYGDAAGIGINALSEGKDLYNASRDELNKTKRSLQKDLRAALPGLQDKLPDKAIKFLEKLGGQADYQYTQADKEADRKNEINGKIDELMMAREEDEQAKRKRQEAEKLINRTVAKKQFATTLAALTSIDRNMALQRAYNNDIGARVQRKMLDLQYRTTYLLADMLQGQGETATAQMEQLKAIVHNTALPEAQKITKSEEFARQNSQRLLNKLGEGLFGETTDYMGKLFRGVSDRAKKSLADTLRNVRQGSGNLSGMVNGIGGMDSASSEETIISMLVGMGGDWASNKYGDKLKAKLEGNEGFNKFQNQVGYGVENAGRLLNARGQQRSNGFGARDRFGDFINGLLATKRLDGNLDDQLDAQGHMPDNFNRMTNRSLIEIIPGLLARIHQSTERMRLKTEDVALIRYDMQTGTFSDKATLTARVRSKLSNKEDEGRNKADLNELMNDLGAGDLTPEQQVALKRHLVQLNMRQQALDPTAIIKHGQFYGGGTPQTKQAIDTHLRKQYTLNEDGSKDLSDTASIARLREQSKKLRGMQQRMMDPTKLVKDIMASGNREELIELGIIDLSTGKPQLNYDRAVDFYMGGGYDQKDGQGGPNPPSNGGSTRVPFRRRVGGMAGQRPDPLLENRGQQAQRPGAAGVATIDYERLGTVIAQAVAKVPVPEVTVKSNTNGIAGTQEEWLEAIHSAIVKNYDKEELQYVGLALEEVIDVLQDGRQFTNIIGGMGGGDGMGGGTPPVVGKWDKRVAALQGGLSRGLMGSLDRLRKTTTWGRNKLPGLMSSAATHATGALAGAKDWYAGKKGIITDIYIRGMSHPALEARKLQLGEYFDAATGHVITKLDDIKGDVRDRYGNVVLTLQDIEKGLRDGTGKAVVLGALGDVRDLIRKQAERAAGIIGGVAGFGQSKLSQLTKWAYNKTQELQDIYVKGELKPRLLKHLVEAGAYKDAVTGQIITKLSDIKGDVLDLQGNLVLSLDDMRKGLVDRWGSPVREGLGKTLDWAKDKINRVKTAVMPNLTKAKDRITSLFSRGKKKAGELYSGAQAGLEALGQGGFDFGIGKAQLDVQQLILEAVNELNPRLRKRVKGDADGDGTRDGSWQDIWRKRGAGDKAKAPGEHQKETVSPDGWKGIGGLLGGAKKKILGLLGLGGDEDDGSLVDDVADSIGGKRRRGKGGLLRRAGRGLGKAASWLGRGAMSLLGMGGGAAAATAAAGEGAALAGTAAASTGLMGGLGAALGAVGTFLASPVVLAVGGVAALGVGAYYLYKWYDESKDRPLQKMRFTQYGWDGKDSDQAKKIAAFEAILLKGVTYGASGAEINSSKEDVKDALDVFGLSADKQDNAMMAFQTWFMKRFKPIFLGWVSALQGIAKEVDLKDADDKLNPDQKMALFNAVKSGSGSDSAYAVALGPFGADVGMLTNQALIDQVIAETGAKITEQMKGSNVVTGDNGKTYQALPLGGDPKALAANQAAKPGGSTANDPGVGATAEKAAMLAGGAVVGVMGMVASPLVQSANAAENSPARRAAGLIPTTKLDALRAIRFRTYGLLMLERNWIRALIELEEAVWDDTKVTAGSATYSGDLDKLTDNYAAYFNLDNPGGPEWNNFQSWFKARFLPVWLAFAGAVQQLDPSVSPGRAHEALDYDEQYSVAMAIIGAQGEYKGSRTSVWSIPLAPNSQMAPNTERRSIQDNLDALKNGQSQKRLDEEAGKPGGTKDGRMAETPGFFSTVADKASNAWTSVKSFFSTVADKEKERATQQPYGKGPASTGPRAPGGGGGVASKGELYTGGAGGMEVILDHPGGGDKGDVNTLPFPTGNKGFEAHKDLIAAVAAMTGMDPKLLAGLIATESNFNSAAKPGTSAAQGLGQFIPGTWKMMMGKYAAAYGIAPNTPATDPRANALMTALFIRDNAKDIQSAIPDRKVNATDLYMAHFLGAAGYKTFLKNPGVPAASIPAMGAAARANPTIFYDQSGRPRTTDEIVSLFNQRLGKNMDTYGDRMAQASANYTPSTDSQTPAATESNTAVQGTEPVDDDAGKATPGMQAAPSAGGTTPDGSQAPSDPSTPASAPLPPAAPPAPPTGITGPSVDPAGMATQAQAQSDAKKAAQDSSMGPLLQVNQDQLNALENISTRMDELVEWLKTQQKTPAANNSGAANGRPEQMPVGPMNLDKRRTQM